MKCRTWVATLLMVALVLGPVHADPAADLRVALAPFDPGEAPGRSNKSRPARAEPPHRSMARMLCGVSVVALQRLAFHSPDPRIGYAYKLSEIETLAGALMAVADHEQAPPEVKEAVSTHIRAMGAHIPSVPMSQIKMEHVMEWRNKMMEAFQKLRDALK